MSTSVVIAAYNGERYILKQLESLYTQKQKPDEVIICDDASWDSTVEIVKKYIARKHLENNWHVYVNEKRLGYSENFFNAVQKATGDYIFFCDQDDVWLENKICEMTGLMELNGDIGLLCSEYIPFAHGSEAWNINTYATKRMLFDNTLEKLNLGRDSIAMSKEGCTMCFRRSFFDKVEKYRIPRILHNEFIWKMALAEDVCYIYHKALVKRRFYAVNMSKSRTARIKRQVTTLRRTLAGNEMILEYLKKNNKSGAETEFLEKNIEALKLRIELINDKKLKNAFILFMNYRQYVPLKK